MFQTRLTVAFLNERNVEVSPWTKAHMEGVQLLQESMADRVNILIYNDVGNGEEAEQAMENAIEEGAQVLFTTTASLIRACRKIAVRYPNVRILNCAVSMPYTGVRTYYSRIYEGKFINGAIAGAMSKSGQLGYVASYPIFGVIAGINAFALGAQLTNPQARVKLLWSGQPGDPIGELAWHGIDMVSTLDITTPKDSQMERGLCRLDRDGNTQLLASPYWDWGTFYIRLVENIMNGGWDAAGGKDAQKAINYWWGMSSGVIGLKLSDDLPDGVQHLARYLQQGIASEAIFPFHRRIRSQDGVLRNDGRHWFTPSDILNMDWLCDTVDGSIPAFDTLTEKAQGIVRLQGIYRDQIKPTPGEVLL